MSSPAEYYNSLPPVSKAYGTVCLLTTAVFQLGLLSPYYIFLDYNLVVKQLQIWRLVTNFFFLGPFSINFAVRLLLIARYGVQLERGPFERRTADFLWMMIFAAATLLAFAIVPALRSPFLGTSLVFMLPYIWAREYPNAQVNISGLFSLKGFYLPWVMLALNVIFGSPLLPDLMGIVVGHLYYFLTELHPRAGGRNILKTPLWVYPSELILHALFKRQYESRTNSDKISINEKVTTKWRFNDKESRTRIETISACYPTLLSKFPLILWLQMALNACMILQKSFTVIHSAGMSFKCEDHETLI